MPLALRNAIHRHTPGFYDHFYYYYLFIHLAWIFLLAMLTNLYMLLLLLCTSNPSNFHLFAPLICELELNAANVQHFGNSFL